MLEVISNRRSIRKYTDKPLEEDTLLKIIEAGVLAPSGSNTQPWHFIVIKSKEMREKVAKVSHNQSWMCSAPVYIVCVADLGSRVENSSKEFIDEQSSMEEVKQIIRDTSISMDHMVLTAESLGIGTCIVAWFRQEEIRPVLNIPSDKYVVSIITAGYSAESPKPQKRKKAEDVLHYETW
ncbi:MAG: nitroreductase family protein [Solirubrobacterales bacterium]